MHPTETTTPIPIREPQPTPYPTTYTDNPMPLRPIAPPRAKTFDGPTGAFLFGALTGTIAGALAGGVATLSYLTQTGYTLIQSLVAGAVVFILVGAPVSFLAFCARLGLWLGRRGADALGQRMVPPVPAGYVAAGRPMPQPYGPYGGSQPVDYDGDEVY